MNMMIQDSEQSRVGNFDNYGRKEVKNFLIANALFLD